MEDLKSQIDKQQREKEKYRGQLMNHGKNIKELEKDKKDLEQDRDFYNKDLKRLNTYMDPNGISPELVEARLNAEDPNAYRQLMKDLKVDGSEPDWDKQEMIEGILSMNKRDQDPNQEPSIALKQEIRDLKKKQQELVHQLRNVEEILRNDVEMDKAQKEETEEQIEGCKTTIDKDKDMMEQHKKNFAHHALKLKDLQKQLPKDTSLLTAANLKQLGVGPRVSNIDEDAMTEFSVLTDESEMQFKENILDLRVSKVELEL